MPNTETWLLISIGFYCLVALVVSIYAFGLRRGSFFEPIGQYLFFCSLFTLPLPIRAYMTQDIVGNVTPHLPTLMPYLPMAVFLVAVTLPFFVAGYYSTWADKFATIIPIPPTEKRKQSFVAFIFLTLLSLILIYLLAEESGGLQSFLLMGYGASSLMYGKGYLAVGFPWLFVASLFLLYRFSSKPSWSLAVLIVLVSISIYGMQFILGNRSGIMYMGLTSLIYLNYGIKRISFKIMLPLIISAFLALNFAGYIRSGHYDSIDDFLDRVTTQSEQAVGEDSDGQGFFYTLTIGEFVVPFETLPQMIKSVGTEISPSFGLTYLRAPLYLIKRLIIPERPQSLAEWYVDEFYHEGNDLNEGRQFFYLAEAYLNGGALGVLLIVLLWGIFWGALHRYMLLSGGAPGVVLLYALSVAFMFRCIAGDFVSLLVGLPQQSLSAAIVGLMIATGFRPWYRITKTQK